MGPVDPDVAVKFQPDLISGESLVWAGRPDRSVIFDAGDQYRIVVGLVCVGLTTYLGATTLGFWSGAERPLPQIFPLFPFFLVGHYLLWGRFVYDAWLKRRTYYGITEQRLIVVQEASKRKTCSIFLDSIPAIEGDNSPTGTLWFGTKYRLVPDRGDRGGPRASWSRFSVRDVPVFVDIDEVDSVHRLILDLSAKAKTRQREPVGALHG